MMQDSVTKISVANYRIAENIGGIQPIRLFAGESLANGQMDIKDSKI